jgi:hypothetical protein
MRRKLNFKNKFGMARLEVWQVEEWGFRNKRRSFVIGFKNCFNPVHGRPTFLQDFRWFSWHRIGQLKWMEGSTCGTPIQAAFDKHKSFLLCLIRKITQDRCWKKSQKQKCVHSAPCPGLIVLPRGHCT